jgi:uncharacterized heparinase superfamily protein
LSGDLKQKHLFFLAAKTHVARVCFSLRVAFIRFFGLFLRSSFQPQIKRLLISPYNLRTKDPTIATDIYAGYFSFAGKRVSTQGKSPFLCTPPTQEWAEVLYGFEWLRHLQVADTPLSKLNARATVNDFITLNARKSPYARRLLVQCTRVMALISHAALILEEADLGFYQRFLQLILQDAADIRTIFPILKGEERIFAALALTYVALCADVPEPYFKKASRTLAAVLSEDIFTDGMHISRNVRLQVDILAALLPLRQAYVSRALEPPFELLTAIDRMMPALRLFRHADGALALFNGMGYTETDLLATLLAYDDARTQANLHAPHGGYERLQAEGSVVIMDVGSAPPLVYSAEAHAGALAFEFSAAHQRIVVNCGATIRYGQDVHYACRTTAAHSTCILENTSSADILNTTQPFFEILSGYVLQSPQVLGLITGIRNDGSQEIQAEHDGYATAYGLNHRRHVILDKTGSILSGIDHIKSAVSGVEGAAAAPSSAWYKAVLRFHLHPSIQVENVDDNMTVKLTLPSQEVWYFNTTAGQVLIEDSIFMATPDAAQPCTQIVVPFAACDGAQVHWRFMRAIPETISSKNTSKKAKN